MKQNNLQERSSIKDHYSNHNRRSRSKHQTSKYTNSSERNNGSTNIDNTTNDSDDASNSTLAPLQPVVLLPETTAYWSREPYAYSSTSIQDYTPPLLTSSKCSRGLYNVFRNTYYNNDVGNIDIEQQPNFLLSLLVEASSHPAGINALYAQPYMYAGPNLGNIDSCPLQTCIAGGHNTDSIIFASVCTVPECTAYDFNSEDFLSTITRQYDYAIQVTTPSDTIDLGREYLLLLRHITEINQFLKGGWTCGNFVVPFDMFPFGLPYIVICCVFILLSIVGTIKCHRYRSILRRNMSILKRNELQLFISSPSPSPSPSIRTSTDTTTTKMNGFTTKNSEVTSLLEQYQPTYNSASNGILPSSLRHQRQYDYDSLLTAIKPSAATDFATMTAEKDNCSFWSAFDTEQHLRRLVQQQSASTTGSNKNMADDNAGAGGSSSKKVTACLDGLRVGSTFWIILGHVLAIQSSSGAGYSNPSNFLPPTGLTTTLIGQLLFSSRLAVDTFLLISGYLVVHVLNQKIQCLNSASTTQSSWWTSVVVRYFCKIPLLIIGRIGRILPLYAMCLGFFTQIAPQMGNGPFWHQWIDLLKPCHDYIWTNFLFINNIFPLNTPTTNTCFYHSWYLAVDMQLYVLAPLIIFWYQYNKWQGFAVTSILLVSSVLITAYWSYIRGWSINTFDGSLVNRYDTEAYSSPIIRAQAYLSGMFVAFVIDTIQSTDTKVQTRYNWIHRLAMTVSLLAMSATAFITVTGAYARRPCTYGESPFVNACGSNWSPYETFFYTAFGRTAWIVGVSVVLFLCVCCARWNHGDGNFVANVLCWPCWTPLSRLSFGAYLIHPIVVFVWQLGDREKQVFRLITFGMDYLSVCVVSFVAALLTAILIELPCADLLKTFLGRHINMQQHHMLTKSPQQSNANGLRSLDSTPTSISPLTPHLENYTTGSLVSN